MLFFCGVGFFKKHFVMYLLGKGILSFPRSPSDFWRFFLFKFGFSFFFKVSAAWSLIGIFRRQIKSTDRSGIFPDLFLNPQRISSAFNSSNTKNPLLVTALSVQVSDPMLQAVAVLSSSYMAGMEWLSWGWSGTAELVGEPGSPAAPHSHLL